MASQTPKLKRSRTPASTGDSPPNIRQRLQQTALAIPESSNVPLAVVEEDERFSLTAVGASLTPYLSPPIVDSLQESRLFLKNFLSESPDKERCSVFLFALVSALKKFDEEKLSGLDPLKLSTSAILRLIEENRASIIQRVNDIVLRGSFQELCAIEELQYGPIDLSGLDSSLSGRPITPPNKADQRGLRITHTPRSIEEIFIAVQEKMAEFLPMTRDFSKDPIAVPNTVSTSYGNLPSLDGKRPSLFFHNLENIDATSRARREEILDINTLVTVFLNVSGSGKTMTCAELLLEKPGLYMTYARSGGLGSGVLKWAMERTTTECSPEHLGQPAHTVSTPSRTRIREVAHYYIDVAFLSYLHMFLWMWERTKDIPMEQRLRNWTYLQLLPNRLLPTESDIFLRLASELSDGTLYRNEVTLNYTQHVALKVKHILQGKSRFYIVLDEANVATKGLLSSAFLSEHPSAQRTDADNRPFLRESFSRGTQNCGLLAHWIVAGTALNKKLLEISLSSGVLKFDEDMSEFSDFGSFNKEDIRPYAVKFLFNGIHPTNEEEQYLLARMETHLTGRKRILVAFIELCLVIPRDLWQTVLSVFFQRISETDRLLPDYRPDSEKLQDVESRLDRFSLQSLLSEATSQQLKIHRHDNEEIRAMINAMGDYLLFGRIDTCSVATSRLVQIGLARTRAWTKIESTGRRQYVGPDLIDEPAAFSCIANCLKDLMEGKTRDLFEGFPSWEASTHGLLFERMSFYNILQLLRNGRRLSEIFAAPAGVNIPWLDQRVIEVLTFDSSAYDRNASWDTAMNSPVLAHKSNDTADTVEWFSQEQHAPGLFPANNLGPDIIIIVRREDMTVVIIEIQCKYLHDPDSKKNVPAPGEAIKTLDHRRWCIPLKKKASDVATGTAKQEKLWQKKIHDKLADRGVNLDRFENHVLPAICCVERTGANHNWRKLAKDYLPAEHIVTVRPEVATRSSNYGPNFNSILGIIDPAKDVL